MKHGTSRENENNESVNAYNEINVPGINALHDNTNPKTKNNYTGNNNSNNDHKMNKAGSHSTSKSKTRNSKPHKSNNLILPHALVHSTL